MVERADVITHENLAWDVFLQECSLILFAPSLK